MKNATISIGILVIVAVVAIGGYFLVQALSHPERDKLSAFERQEFMDGCYDGTNYSYCICALNYLDEHFTNKAIYNMGMEYDSTGKISDDMWDAVNDCMYLL